MERIGIDGQDRATMERIWNSRTRRRAAEKNSPTSSPAATATLI
jgi:hypothetical protein